MKKLGRILVGLHHMTMGLETKKSLVVSTLKIRRKLNAKSPKRIKMRSLNKKNKRKKLTII